MTGPPVSASDVDPLVALKQFKAQDIFRSDPLDELKAMRGGASNIHDEFKSGHLAARMADENAGEQALDAPAEKMGVGGALATSFANTARGLPGVPALQDALRAVVRRQSYTQAKGDIDAATSRIPGVASRVQRMVGAAPAASVLPANPAVAGGILGAADQVLSDDPTTGVGGRAVGGLLGGILGAASGHAVGTSTTLARAAVTPKSSTNILAKEAARDAASETNYAKAIAEGQGKTGTPAIARMLAKPDIAEIQARLLAERPYQGAKPNSPEVLDAIYKVLSDRDAQLKRGLESPTPNKPNIGRFEQEDIRLAKQEMLDAMSGGWSMPGPMRSYRPAVEEHAVRSGDIDALRGGHDVLRSAIGKGVTTGKNLDRTTPEAFAQWAADHASPSERGAASEGILGATKEDFFHNPTRNLLGFRAVGKAGGLLRSADTPQQRIIDLLTKTGLVSANAAVQ